MSEVHKFHPPFSVYDNFVEIGDEDGHVCTAENPDIAKAIVIALNSHADLVAALEDIASTFDAAWLSGSVERCVGDRAREALAKAKGG